MTRRRTAPADRPGPHREGLRGVYAAVLVLEAIVVGLALLVLPKFGAGATPLGVGLIGGLAVAMVVASGAAAAAVGAAASRWRCRSRRSPAGCWCPRWRSWA